MADKDKPKGILGRIGDFLQPARAKDERRPKTRSEVRSRQPSRTVPIAPPRRPTFETARHPLMYGHPPDWASGWGEDRYGVFVEFTIGDVTQRLRWIGPGRFLMGSPEDEPGRNGAGEWNEGPQHEVRISTGFWLFDTPVTQALWIAVMGDNPSHFKDPQHPVERVSWDDVTRFLDKINTDVSGLDLVLPTEAQWEYACRAGTATPFWWGSSITPEQANYDGNYPYEGGSKGEYRERTVPVKSFEANPWGLCQVHGNVWEWCADGLRVYGGDAVTDPVGSLESARRALRGGSWRSLARRVRAASRFAYARDYRYRDIGFRCARVQSWLGKFEHQS